VGGVLPGELIIGHARVAGRVRRALLEHELERVDVRSIAGGDEVLVVPVLWMPTAPSSTRPSGHFASRLTGRLRLLRDAATVDPAGLAPGAVALRFTSRERYAAWLIAAWLAGPAAIPPEMRALMPEPAAIRAWIAREVLSNGPVLMSVARQLRSRRLLASWLARLDGHETAAVVESLHRGFAMPANAEPAAAEQEEALAAGPQARVVPRGPPAGSRQDLPSMNRILGLLDRCWAELIAAEPLAEALDPPRAEVLLALATLLERPNLGRQLAPVVLRRIVARNGRATAAHRTATAQPGSTSRPPGVTGPGLAHRPVVDRGSPPDESADEDREPSPAPQAIARARPSAIGAAGRQQVPTHYADTSEAAEIAGAEPPAARQKQLETGFGGVFFLLNILLACGLYPDFTRPRDRGLDPSPFWLLDRLARRMFGRQYRGDPLSGWLRREGLPGALPRGWRADPHWLRGLPPGRYAFRNSRHRTVLWDLRGFALCDLPSRPDRARLLERYRRCGEQVRRPRLARRPMPRDPDERWIACLAEFLVARIALAGEGLDAGSLRLRARLALREDRVEVTFGLAELPIAVRLAGLDRDPGWLPAEGRSVYFSFE
jgi:hypothetical protein